MSGNYGDFDIDICLKEINYISEMYGNIAVQISADLDSISVAWHGGSALRLMTAAESVKSDSANIKKALAEVCELMEYDRLTENMEKLFDNTGKGE